MSTPDEIAAALGSFGMHDEESTVTTFLSSGYPEFDHMLSNGWDGSGFPVGRCIEIYGPESSGKTAIATQAMISAQKMGGYAGFNDHERSFQQYLAEGQGLDPHPGRFNYKKPETFEDSLAHCVQVSLILRDKKLIAPEAPICWVFDSLASMVPQSALYDKNGKRKAPGDRTMNDNTALARATSAHFPGFAQDCDNLGICALFLNQIRLNIGIVYGNPETTPGGKSPKYYFSQRISLGARPIRKGEGEAAEVVGSQITAKTIKNKVTRPFRKSTFRFEFKEDGTGYFNIVRSTIDFLVSEKILKMAGGRIEWTDGSKPYATQLADKLAADPTGMDQLRALLPEVYTPAIVAEIDDTDTSSVGDAA